MRTDKHKLILNQEQKDKLFALICAYQKQKNYFSDWLNSKNWNDGINFKKGFTYFEIEALLIKKPNFRKFGLSARVWKRALKEAFDLHNRTYSAKIEHVKEIMVNFCFTQKLSDCHLYFINSIFYNFSTFKKFEQL